MGRKPLIIIALLKEIYMIPKNILNALKKFYQIVNDKNIPWILSGSTSLAIQGVDVAINDDIDILTTAEGSKKIQNLLKEYLIHDLGYSRNPNGKYQSFFQKYKIDSVKVEVMGEFQYRLKNGQWSKPNQDHEIFIKKYQGMSLPLLSLKQELEEYQNLGKDDKVKKIKTVLK